MKLNPRLQMIALSLMMLALSACGTSSGGPQVWFDRPLDNTTAPLAPLTIQAHASDESGVAKFEFYANDMLLFTVDSNGSRLSEAIVEWTPPEPGVYRIDVRAIDTKGNIGSDATVVVTIDGKSIFDDTVRITGAECAEGLTVNVDINIIAPNGIASYAVFSTWVAAEVGETFTGSLPGNISKRVQLTEPYPDDMVRNHQIGLKVMIDGDPSPHYAYAFEPNNLCPGHYEAPNTTPPICSLSQLIAPILQTPADNASVNTTVNFAWSDLQYKEIGCHPHSWRVDISENSNFNDNSLGFGTLDHLETSRNWPLPVGKCYYWRVLAYVPDDYGPPSTARYFCVPESPTPQIVTLTPIPTVTPSPTVEIIVDTTPPSFYSTEVSPDTILNDVAGCSSYERTTIVAAAVAEAGGLSSVIAYWDIGGVESGQANLQEGGLGYWASLGPVNTVGIMEIYMVAVDTSGNSAQSDMLYVTVNNCIN